jgi:hypothetical protein
MAGQSNAQQLMQQSQQEMARKLADAEAAQRRAVGEAREQAAKELEAARAEAAAKLAAAEEQLRGEMADLRARWARFQGNEGARGVGGKVRGQAGEEAEEAASLPSSFD